mmetsp:Transcript_56723/g.139200  ORF Transcript_56723/g.139200 Transcript_56723/m.139200 type:complete len:262 (+) Transcript_56723:167-952(+)
MRMSSGSTPNVHQLSFAHLPQLTSCYARHAQQFRHDTPLRQTSLETQESMPHRAPTILPGTKLERALNLSTGFTSRLLHIVLTLLTPLSLTPLLVDSCTFWTLIAACFRASDLAFFSKHALQCQAPAGMRFIGGSMQYVCQPASHVSQSSSCCSSSPLWQCPHIISSKEAGTCTSRSSTRAAGGITLPLFFQRRAAATASAPGLPAARCEEPLGRMRIRCPEKGLLRVLRGFCTGTPSTDDASCSISGPSSWGDSFSPGAR